MSIDHASPAKNLYTVTAGGNRKRTYKPHKALARRMRLAVFGRDNFTCLGCGYHPDKAELAHADWGHLFSPGNLSLDHIIPYAHGGRFELDNLQTLCLSCNSRKGTGL